jgi:hypothetical protein
MASGSKGEAIHLAQESKVLDIPCGKPCHPHDLAWQSIPHQEGHQILAGARIKRLRAHSSVGEQALDQD